MVEKIKGLVTEVTVEQKDIEWSEVHSVRFKLLQLSDWTQLEDVTLPEACKREWRLWRQKVRNVNRNTTTTPKMARDALSTLQQIMPNCDEIDTALFEKKLTEQQEAPAEKNVRYEKVIVKEQPVILTQQLPESEFERLLNAFMHEKPVRFKEILQTIMAIETNVIIFPDDTVETVRPKLMSYLKTRQKEILNQKLTQVSNLEVLGERVEQALTYMTTMQPNIEDYPLVHLYADVNKTTFAEAAQAFLEEKRQYNQILFEAERFLMYTKYRIDNAQTIEDLKEILKVIRNGY